MSEERRRDLAQLLRTRREAISPADVGIAAHGRRRTPGLRREEVAYLANIGTTWYSRLEMAHDVKASPHTLLAIAHALRFTVSETEYLFMLADMPLPSLVRSLDLPIPEALEALVRSVHDVGIAIWDQYLTSLRWNAISDAMFDYSSYPDPLGRNSLFRLLREENRAASYGYDHLTLLRSLVGMFRRAYVRAEPGAVAREIFEALQTFSLFRELWDAQVIADDVLDSQSGPFGRYLETVGRFSVVTTNLRVARRDDLIIRINAPADEASAKVFARLRTLGTVSARQA
ncbi:MAG TPA: helix-turn-helix domain-containing protein [Candidatus Lustribacter sp.]|jgi:hypothetical protein|nr:helix-turn-helix domain-containing protein [Candidatus Lustribacter sp.]